MKKIIIASLVASSFAFGASDEQIKGFYSQMLPSNVKVSIDERIKVQDDIEAIVVKLSDDKVSENDVIFTKGDFVFPDVIDLKEGKSYKSEINNKIIDKKVSVVYKSESKDNIISLGNDSKKPTKVMFSDPECPYCRAELAQIEKHLKTENIKIILTPVHDISSLEKSHLIYKETATAKSDSDKVKILRKYFAEDAKVPENSVSEKEVAKMNELRQKYFSAGIRSVPKYLDEANLIK